MLKMRLKTNWLVGVFGVLCVASVVLCGCGHISSAEAAMHYMKYAANGIWLPQPKDECAVSTTTFRGDEITWEDLMPLTGNDRLKLLVETYGEYAMDLQRTYGVPWEMPFAVMVYESGVGTDTSSVSYLVQQAGYYNMMGLTDPVPGKTAEDEIDHYRVQGGSGGVCFRNQTYTECHVGYDSISKMLLGYAIYHARSGYEPERSYDAGLKLLEPNNYRLGEAILRLMETYCEGGCYRNEIMGMIRPGGNTGGWTGLLDVVREKGWKNSEELARDENIQPGGTATAQWGWGDIRQKVWQAYGEGGLPDNLASNHLTSVSTSKSGAASATVGSFSLHSPSNPWLDGAGLEGFTISKALNSKLNGMHVDTAAMVEGTDTYKPFAPDAGGGSGLPGAIVLHWTAASDFSGDPVTFCGDTGVYICPPHFTVDVKNRKIWQHFPLSSPSAAVGEGSDGTAWDAYVIQIEVVGHGGTGACIAGSCSDAYNIYNFSAEDWDYLAKLLVKISDETGIPLQSDLAWDESESQRTILDPAGMRQYVGVMGHIHVDGYPSGSGHSATNAYNKNDPGKMWQLLVPALERVGYVYNSQPSGTCSTARTIGSCFALPESDGGCTEDGMTYYWQNNGGKASWSSVQMLGCSRSTIGSAGCGYASLAGVMTALTGEKITPLDVFNYAKRSSPTAYYVCGAGTLPELIPGVINNSGTGLKVESHGSNQDFTRENINRYLREGKMLVFSVGAEVNQVFTGGSHWIAVRALTPNGKWKIFQTAPRPDHTANDVEYDPQVVIEAHVNHRSYWYVVSR